MTIRISKAVQFQFLLMILVTLAVCTHTASADSFQFSLIPTDGEVTGEPGSSVGWGYSITNQSSTDWLVTTDLIADSFLHGTPMLLFDFPTIAPGQTITAEFDASAQTGLYELTWDSDAPNRFVNMGNFVLSAQWWDGDPLSGGSEIATAPDATAAYSATASIMANNVPEPSTWPLMVSILGFAIYRVRRRVKI